MLKIAVVGGDLRQCYLAKKLLDAGYEVKAFDISCRDILRDYENVVAVTLEEALDNAKVVILPTPVHERWFFVSELLDSETVVFGWNIPKEFDAFKTYDFKDMEEVALRNAVATAEGTIAEMIINSEINLTGSKCLVVGYGRCGKEIAARLRQIGAYVTVMARDRMARDDAAFHGMDTCAMFDRVSYDEYDFIVNTVPARVLGKNEIDKFDKDALIVDIATMPGGTDFVYCKSKGIKAVHSLGLPGKYSPKTSGEILGNAILDIIKGGV